MTKPKAAFSEPPSQTGLRTSLFARGLALARLALMHSSEFKKLGASLFEDHTDRERKTEPPSELSHRLREQAQQLAQEMSQLKGGALKVGQLLSMYGEVFLPPSVNDVLKALQSECRPLDWALLEPVLKAEVPSYMDDLDLNPQPVACASIGQVYQAHIKRPDHTDRGRSVAIKLQYSGIEEAVESDLKALRTLVRFAPGVPRGQRMDAIVTEIHELLRGELDYLAEAEALKTFKEQLATDSRFYLPKVYGEWSTRKVLTAEFIEGARFDSPEVRSLSQDRRNRIGNALLELYLRELFEFKMVQTDPHLGNYKWIFATEQQADQVALLDFGAVRRLSDNFVRQYKLLVKSALHQDRPRLIESARAIGFLLENDPEAVEHEFFEFCRLVVEPFASSETYKWSESDLPQRIAKQLSKVVAAKEFRPPPREPLFLDRKSTGLYTLLCVLRAETEGRDLLLKYVDSPD